MEGVGGMGFYLKPPYHLSVEYMKVMILSHQPVTIMRRNCIISMLILTHIFHLIWTLLSQMVNVRLRLESLSATLSMTTTVGDGYTYHIAIP